MKFNRITLIGNLTRDPETRHSQNGKAICNFTLAVNDEFNKEEKPLFIKAVTFGKTAEVADKYLQKGAQALVEGRLKISDYETKEGEKRQSVEVIVNSLQLGSKGNGASTQQSAPSKTSGPNQDEMPF